MGEPCINKKCGAYEKDEDYNCGHIILDDPTKCRCYLTIKTASGSKVPCSVGLCADVIEGSMEDLSFLIEMSETLKEGRHRNDSVRLDHVQQMIDDWIDQLKSA